MTRVLVLNGSLGVAVGVLLQQTRLEDLEIVRHQGNQRSLLRCFICKRIKQKLRDNFKENARSGRCRSRLLPGGGGDRRREGENVLLFELSQHGGQLHGDKQLRGREGSVTERGRPKVSGKHVQKRDKKKGKLCSSQKFRKVGQFKKLRVCESVRNCTQGQEFWQGNILIPSSSVSWLKIYLCSYGQPRLPERWSLSQVIYLSNGIKSFIFENLGVKTLTQAKEIRLEWASAEPGSRRL